MHFKEALNIKSYRVFRLLILAFTAATTTFALFSISGPTSFIILLVLIIGAMLTINEE